MSIVTPVDVRRIIQNTWLLAVELQWIYSMTTRISTTTAKRSDPHRPGAIIPAHYEHWTDYSLPSSSSGYPMPRMGIDCSDPVPQFDARGMNTGYNTPRCHDTGRCCVASAERHARRDGHAVFGVAGKCGVCGAHFVHGSTFKHENGEIVHMGHDCADKYELMYDLSARELERGRVFAAHGKAIARSKNESQRRAFLDAHPGLEAALALGKPQGQGTRNEAILDDMAGRFTTWRELSEKQVAFALKLAHDIQNPVSVVDEKHCPAPIGKGVEFEGEIVSCKITDGFMGASTYKMTIKVTTPDGATWLAYGTCPSSLTECLRPTSHWGGGSPKDLRGRHVAVKASLELPRTRPPSEFDADAGPEATGARPRATENHFAFMSRPSARFIDVHGPIREVPKAPKAKRAKKAKADEKTDEATAGQTSFVAHREEWDPATTITSA